MTAVAIFVKTPGLSPVKTRLAETVGSEFATALYLASAASVVEAAREAAIGPVYWASAEPGSLAEKHWTDLPLVEQGEGGLGARMHRVLDVLVDRHGSALLLGADAPQLDPALLRRAEAWLASEFRARVVGPARDGGFWTFGANHAIELKRWTGVTYSRPDTLMHFRSSVGADAEWLELPILSDLDTIEDLERVAGELRGLPDPLPAQRALIDRLAESKALEPAIRDPEP